MVLGKVVSGRRVQRPRAASAGGGGASGEGEERVWPWPAPRQASKRWLRPASARPAVRVCDKRQVTRVTQSLPRAPGENCRAPAGSSGSGGGKGGGGWAPLQPPEHQARPGRCGWFGPRGTLEPSVGVMSQVLGKPQLQGEDGGDDEEEDELVGLAGYEDGPGSSDAELDSGPEEGGEPACLARTPSRGRCAERCGERGSWAPGLGGGARPGCRRRREGGGEQGRMSS